MHVHDAAQGNHVILLQCKLSGHRFQGLHDGLDVIVVKEPLCEQLLDACEGDAGKLWRPDAACCQERLQDILQVSACIQ